MLALGVIQVDIHLVPENGVLVGHLVTAQNIHQLKFPVLVDCDVNVVLRLQ